MKNILLIGAAGYVGLNLYHYLFKDFNIISVDKFKNETINHNLDVSSVEFVEFCKKIREKYKKLTIINLASAKYDYGLSASEYYRQNVDILSNFFKGLEQLNIEKFIHVSSVAALDGSKISFNENLDCDDSYRSTKYIQQIEIEKWCKIRKIKNSILLPSAIFSSNATQKSNIGKLQILSRFIPFIPKINVLKSLTYLPSLCKFIKFVIENDTKDTRYLTIEKPVLEVSIMIQILTKKKIIFFPLMKFFLSILSKLLWFISIGGKIDTFLTSNRVEKLFKDTSYSNIKFFQINDKKYNEICSIELNEILKKL